MAASASSTASPTRNSFPRFIDPPVISDWMNSD
jgi:hypothetical protein